MPKVKTEKRIISRVTAYRPLIVIRYFEILEVDGKEVGLSSAVNEGSRRLIEIHGGDYLGTGLEEFEVPDKETGSPVNLKVLWHFWLSDREDSILKIENLQKPL